MCVAAIVFKPVQLEYLECMENDNPHGAGVAWLQGEEIRFMRGLTAKDIFQLQSDEVMSYPYLMHFRWATHGAKIAELTHPFPIGPRALLGERSGGCKALLIHNGTWGGYERAAAKYISAGNYEIPEELIASASDTAVAAWLAQDNPDILDEIMWATAVAEITETTDDEGNLKKTMEITTRGTWSDKEGNWYSNLNWVPWSGSYYHSSFPDGYNYNRHARDAYWKEWDRRFMLGEDTSELSYPTTEIEEGSGPSRHKDIDWDLYFLAPFGTRDEDEKHLTFDQYVERFKKHGNKQPLPHTQDSQKDPKSNGSPSRSEMSWNDYLVAKYGAAVAKQITEDCFPDSAASNEDQDTGGSDDVLPLSLVCGYSAADESDESDSYIDPDLVSEDWETVNAVLARQMSRHW